MTALAKFLTPNKQAFLFVTIDNYNISGVTYGDNFGSSVAIDGNYVVVGSPYESYANYQQGIVYVFNATTGSYLTFLRSPFSTFSGSNQRFGESVDISGNYAIVGAPGFSNSGYYNSGLIAIYDVNTGSRVYYRLNPNTDTSDTTDYFGGSVAIDGNYAIVGAYNEDDAGDSNSGKAYIFYTANGSWIDTSLIYTLDNPNAYDTSANDNFGFSVAISGNYAIVGAPYEDDASGLGSGKAYIFDVTTGSLVYTLDNPNAYDTSAGDNFGFSVAIDGNYAIVGARYEDDAGGSNSGKAYIFYTANGTWADAALLHTLDNPNAYDTSAGDLFGRAVAISGNYAIVNAISEEDANGLNSGKVYIFDVTTGTLLRTLHNPNAYGTSAGDNFGVTIATDGTKAIVGVPNEDDATGSSSGKAYVFGLY